MANRMELVGYSDGMVGAIPMNTAGLRRMNEARTVGQKLLPTSQREQMLGLGSVSIPAASTANLSTVVQKAIQGTRLMLITAATLGEVTVTDVKIGTRSQLAGVDALPVEAFGQLVTDSGIDFDPAQTGVTLTVQMANSGAGPNVVAGALYGVAAG